MFIEAPALAARPHLADITYATAAANAAVTVTFVGVPGYRHYIPLLIWSYSAAPTGGKLTITGLDGDDVEFDITAPGPGPVFLPPMAGGIGENVVITLAAAGGGVVGKLNVFATPLPAYVRFEGRLLVGG